MGDKTKNLFSMANNLVILLFWKALGEPVTTIGRMNNLAGKVNYYDVSNRFKNV